MEISLGDIVKSLAGRDKGEIYLVVALDGDFAYAVNGRSRKSDNPKKKRSKHLNKLSHSEFAEGKLQERKLTNVEIRRELEGISNIK